MRLKLHILLILLFPCLLYATGDSTRYLTPKDTIFIYTGSTGDKIFEHTIEKKQTLFSLGKFYGLSVEELYFYNTDLEAQSIKLHQKIRVPIPNRAILRYKTADFQPDQYIPVYYVVQRSETMFRISKYHFQMPMEEIMARNNMTSPDLKEGQQLFVGWMSLEGIPEEARAGSLGGPNNRRNNALRKIFERNTYESSLYHSSGAAFWRTNSGEGFDFFALHRSARVNSIIEITNPMKERKVYAKVAGKIPETAYDDDVIIVVSPMVARLLGAKDQRFFVKLRYQK